MHKIPGSRCALTLNHRGGHHHFQGQGALRLPAGQGYPGAQQVQRGGGHLLHMGRDGRQGRVQQGRPGGVVTGHHRNLFRHRDVQLPHGPHGTDGHLFVGGDEGSGAYLGKRFLGDCLKGLLPDQISNEMLDELQLTAADILEKVYRQPQANRFLAGIVPCIHKHKAIPEIHSFLTDCFSDFIRRNVLPYHASLPVSFTGSVAWFFQEEIKETLASLNLTTGIFVKNPIKELVDYHLRICR